jgi:hypothetical protein
MPAPASASQRSPDNPSDQALAAIVVLLKADGYGFAISASGTDANFRVSSVRRMISGLTITDNGGFTWDYRFGQCPCLDPSRLIGITSDFLAPTVPGECRGRIRFTTRR